MIIISSFRPFSESESYAAAQIEAKRSWDKVASEIIYVGGPSEDVLRTGNTKFMIQRGIPTIRELAEIAGTAGRGRITYVAIANADIVITPNFSEVEQSMNNVGLPVATSRRWTFYNHMDDAKLLPGDFGLDIFVAMPEVWEMVSANVPAEYTIGSPGWDDFLVRFLHHLKRGEFKDFTNKRCIFHKFHQDRGVKAPINTPIYLTPPPTIKPLKSNFPRQL